MTATKSPKEPLWGIWQLPKAPGVAPQKCSWNMSGAKKMFLKVLAYLYRQGTTAHLCPNIVAPKLHHVAHSCSTLLLEAC